MKSLLLLALILVPGISEASGWFSTVGCTGNAITNEATLKVAPGKDLYNCITNTTASPVIDVSAKATMTFYGTAPTVTINRCTDKSGTKCEVWWQMVNTSCVVAAADPCNHAELNSGFYSIVTSATEANALVSVRGNQ